MGTSNHENIIRKIVEAEHQLSSLRKQQIDAEAKLRSLKKDLADIGQPRNLESNRHALLPSPPARSLSPTEKVEVFRRLFRGRDDVYPKFWQNQETGKKGYSPACTNRRTGKLVI